MKMKWRARRVGIEGVVSFFLAYNLGFLHFISATEQGDGFCI
jgi:hypothetical protein